MNCQKCAPTFGAGQKNNPSHGPVARVTMAPVKIYKYLCEWTRPVWLHKYIFFNADLPWASSKSTWSFFLKHRFQLSYVGLFLADCNYSNEKLLAKNSKILYLTLFSWTFTSEVSAFKENLGEVAEILRLNFLDILRRQRRRLTSLFQNKPWQRRALIRQPKPWRGLGPRTLPDHWTLRCLLS